MFKKCSQWLTASRTRMVSASALFVLLIAGLVWLFVFQGSEPLISSWDKRVERRAYSGAPPVIPHRSFGSPCITCHQTQDKVLPDIGIAPANPHLQTAGLSESSNCRQCHVFRNSDDVFVATNFLGTNQGYQPSSRLYATAPPVVPHRLFMHENCLACHHGQAVRPEIRCTHPERINCKQCHAFRTEQ